MTNILLCSTSKGIFDLFNEVKKTNFDMREKMSFTCIGNSIFLVFLIILSIKPSEIERILKDSIVTLQKICPNMSITDGSKDKNISSLEERLKNILIDYGFVYDENILLSDFCNKTGYDIRIPTYVKTENEDRYTIIDKDNFNGRLFDAIIISLLSPGFITSLTVLEKTYFNHLPLIVYEEYIENSDKYNIKYLEIPKLEYNKAKEDSNILYKKEVFLLKEYILFMKIVRKTGKNIIFYGTVIEKE
jgi:hypothetical protein